MPILTVAEIIQHYRDYAKIPKCDSAKIVYSSVKPNQPSQPIIIQSIWTQRDLEQSETSRFALNYVVTLDNANLELLLTTQPNVTTSELLSSTSPSNSLRAVLRKVSSKKPEDKHLIEIWCNNHKAHNYDVSTLDKHGQVYEDEQFGCFEWSSAETHLLYIAEKKKPKAVSFFDNKFNSDQNHGDGGDELIAKGKQHLYREDWGETLVGKYQPMLCVMDVTEGSVSVLENLPDYISPGQALWTHDDAGVVCVGWWHIPYKLGLIYCPVRRSALFHIELEKGDFSIIGSSEKSVRSPVFNEDKSRLVYLENDAGGPHQKSSRLMMCDWASKNVSVIVDTVDSPNADQFPGIYSLRLPKRCWAKDGIRIVMHTSWRSGKELIVINTENKEMTRITNSMETGAWSLMDINEDIMVASVSCINEAPHLVMGILPQVGQEENVRWTKLDDNYRKFPEINWKVLTFNPPPENVNSKYYNLTYQAIFICPSNEIVTKSPLIVWPHGGPHSSFDLDFQLLSTLMVKLDFAVLLVNFRGSTGFGEDNLNSLPGNIGTQDVRDVQFAVESVVTSEEIDQSKIFLFGGSHGGFLSVHLVGQYPDFYKACVCRNPVVNITSKFGSTDIPDWGFEESNIPFDFKFIPSDDMLRVLWSKSPLQYANNIKVPILLLVGQLDLRVPPKQSQELYRALRARGVPVKMFCYADNHSLSKVDVEADSVINSILWFFKYW